MLLDFGEMLLHLEKCFLVNFFSEPTAIIIVSPEPRCNIQNVATICSDINATFHYVQIEMSLQLLSVVGM